MKKNFFFGLMLVFGLNGLFAQNLFFNDAGQNKKFKTTKKRVIIPIKYRGLTLNYSKAKKFLDSVPNETLLKDRNKAPVFTLIKPDGTRARFRVWESSVQEAGTPKTADYVSTFAGQGVDEPYAAIRFDFSKFGFHAQVRTPNGDYFIDPYAQGETKRYIVYYRSDLKTNTRPPDIVYPADSIKRRNSP